MEAIGLLVVIAIWFAITTTLKKRGKSFIVRNLIACLPSLILGAIVAAVVADGRTGLVMTALVILVIVLLMMIGSDVELENKEHKEAMEALQAENEELLARLEQAKPYLHIADVEQEATDIRKNAKDVLDKAKAEADKLNKLAKKTHAQAQQDADDYRKQQYALIDKEILDLANNKDNLQNQIIAAKSELIAIENQINGYGDEWIVPRPSFIDDLAEAYSFKEVGEKLKALRQELRVMIKTNMAATCEYAEPNRRATAIHFVTDAYNGKIDSILAKAKTENYGILKQQMQDAFTLVNSNGRAFRDAKITHNYHLKRLKELEYIIAINQIKQAEREEQRLIREKIREEEKAAREYERALKEAKREEEIIAKAIAKKQAEMQAVNELERAALQAQLDELQAKYEEAEAKNQRALSMAQQTKSGHVYVISNIGSFGDDVFKVGMTRRLEPLDRVRELGDASVPFSFDVHAMIYSDNAPALEYELHKLMRDNQINKVNPRKEFFRISLSDIRAHIEKMGIEAHWTITAEAAEYKESLAMTRAGIQANILPDAEGIDD